MSLYEHIARSNENEAASVLPNPMNAMRSDSEASLKSKVFSFFLWSQIALFVFFIGYLMYKGFLANVELRSQEKAAQMLSEEKQRDALLSQVYREDPLPDSLMLDNRFDSVFTTGLPADSTRGRGTDSVQADREELSWMGKNAGLGAFPSGNAEALKVAVRDNGGISQPQNPPEKRTNLGQVLAESPVVAMPVPPAVSTSEGIFKVHKTALTPEQDVVALKRRAEGLWQQAVSAKSSLQMQEVVKLVGASSFSEFFQDKFSVLAQQSWVTVLDFCQASSQVLEKDTARDQVVLTCSDYFTDRGDFSQALTLYSFKPSMQSHQDFYSRLAYVALKNEKFAQASGLYQRLLQLDPKNARWWLGLGWALRGQGDAKLAYEAYAKAYKYAQPGAEFKPFLQSVLQNG
jgi:tetratricopeptide (TPR) repeat protein